MKKIVSLIAFLSFTFSLTFAQADVRFGFQLSPSFGWMTANVNSINPSGTNIGLKLGMIGEYYFQENYAFTSGIGFAFNHGGTLLHEDGGNYWNRTDIPEDKKPFPDQVKLKYGIQYVEIPVGLKMRTKEFGYFRYYIQPAITIGLKTQAQGSVKGTNIGEDLEKLNIKDEVNSLNLSWGIGGGIEYGVSENTAIVAGLALQVGFTDATDDNGIVIPTVGDTRDEDAKGTVNGITLIIGVMF